MKIKGNEQEVDSDIERISHVYGNKSIFPSPFFVLLSLMTFYYICLTVALQT